MDGFDDLLAPSRTGLESNPFEDPFAKRSGSPDPWTSAFQQPAAYPGHDDAFGGGFGASSSSTSPTAERYPAQLETSDSGGFSQASDPLDSANATRDEDDAPAHDDAVPETPVKTEPTPSSPGFRESIPSTIDEVIAPLPAPAQSPPLTPAEEETTTPSAPTPTSRHVPPPLTSTLSDQPPETPASDSPISITRPEVVSSRASTQSQSSSLQPASTTTSPKQPVFSPLDQPQPTGLGFERSFAGLSIGGETFGGGWGSGTTPFSATHFNQVSANQSEDDDDDDDDDDKPILQTRASLQAQAAAAAANANPVVSKPPTDQNGLQPVFVITVDDPQRVGDPIRAYTMYTVHTKTTSPLFSKSSFSVLRRYSEFLWLYETLSVNNPGVVVPPVPEKNAYGLGRFESTFVEQRRSALEKCVMKIAVHPVLQKDPDFKLFLESDSFSLDIKHRKAEMAHEKGGLMASIGQTLAGPRFYETDEWFDKQKSYLDSLELQLRGLVKTIDLVTKHRADIAQSAGEFAQTLQDLSTSDIGASLSGALEGLAVVERKAQECQVAQAHADVATLMSIVDEYARLINSVRLAFTSRIRTYHAWQNADANVKRVKQTHEANRAQGRLPSDQLSRSLAFVGEAERRALEAKSEFDQVSKLVKTEVARFEHERIEDFKNAMEAFLDGMIVRQKDLISAWEGFQQSLLRKVNGQQVVQQPVPVAADA
ncbi:Vacuolar protein sorting-associated protein 5 [Steccherinum ochraceum]|uniref:Vacuolar protein sorting-associated protein 5 n=1 Tax=Steccherinum ochraceum TaxID=92696 RepID=A0A4R0RSK7_9APHY|nr:Vacuolar protein sorting-associated protein 5 [Steccherinum ochraceum]